jgi:hypothetical protein
VYPGCAAQCNADPDIDLADGLRIHCAHWEAIY